MTNGNEPATKADLVALRQEFKSDLNDAKAEIKAEIEALEVRMDNRFNAWEHRMDGVIQDIEGRIITTIYRLLEAGGKRLTEAERETAAIKDRLAFFEQRLADVEKRLDMPPRQQQP